MALKGSGRGSAFTSRSLTPGQGGREEAPPPADPPLVEPSLATLADQRLLEHLAPAAVVVRRTGEIVRLQGRMDRYLRLPTGDPPLDLLPLVHDELKPALRAALHEAVHRHRESVHVAVAVERDTGQATLRLTVRLLRARQNAERFWLIIFEEAPASAAVVAPALGGDPPVVLRLEAELRAAQQQQQHLIDQLENSNEELKAANEEVRSMNEDLIASNEELTSMNEELTSLNARLQDTVHEVTAVNDDLTNLLVSTDIATVFVDSDFRIKRFTTAATRLLKLSASDVGRPIDRLGTNLVHVDLSADARTVLSTLIAIEKEVAARDGKEYLVRVFPYRTQDGTVHGVVLALVDVTRLKQAEHALRAAQDELRRLNQSLEQRVADRTKWLALMHAVTLGINDAPSWDDALHVVLQRICDSEHWQIGFVYLPDRDTPDAISPAISCFGDERFRPFHGLSEHQRYRPGESLPGRVYAEGVPVWVNEPEQLFTLLPIRGAAAKRVGMKSAVALPIRFEHNVVAVLELFSNETHEPSDLLENLMVDVGTQIGRVVERERATAQMADWVWREQQALAHTLHDSLGQTLAGLGMLSSGLRQQLAGSNQTAADTARLVAEQAQLAIDQVRQMSRGLFPVDIDPQGLPAALRALASTTEALHKIHVHVEGETPRSIRDSRVATQLYRIAQEAVTNAVKHARARTITIQIHAGSNLTKLRVTDDGAGMPEVKLKSNGLGLRIMRYRATSIGALLSIEPNEGGGTIVTCTLRETPPRDEAGAPP
jgi:two-component system, chemotaxis family, CheB/CheR fusion protein